LILVDSSAWIEFGRATGTPVDLRLTELLDSPLIVATTEPVNMEVLAGARTAAEEATLWRMLAGAHLVSFDSEVDFEAAARIYRRCRVAGITPRSMIDCMIASVAMRHRAAILANDTDFARIASVVALELDPATPTQ
jgi:hypothetical protein